MKIDYLDKGRSITLPCEKIISRQTSCRYSDLYLVSFSGQKRLIKCPKPTCCDVSWREIYRAEFERLSRVKTEGVPEYFSFIESGLTVISDNGEKTDYPCALMQEYIDAIPWADCAHQINDVHFAHAMLRLIRILTCTNRAGIYHLDISPRNILLRISEGGISVFLIDFTGGYISPRPNKYTLIHHSDFPIGSRTVLSEDEILSTQTEMILRLASPVLIERFREFVRTGHHSSFCSKLDLLGSFFATL